MRQLILGTAGHIDHGKTALVHALTGVDTDRLPEEKRRGITIDLGFADLTLDDDLHVGIIDVPGHESFIRNMLAGATGIDLGLLVVAADEGVMPQTREHLAILELLGVRDLVVALTKSDLAEADWRELVEDDTRELLAGGPFADCPLIAVSARTGDGLETLRDALRTRAHAVESRAANDLFRLPVDRVFTVRGTGTVVTGTLWSGTVRRDQTIHILSEGSTKARVRAVQTHGLERDLATAGERTALALAGVDRDAIARGDVLVDDPAWEAGSILTARLRVLEAAPKVRRGQRVRFHLGTSEVAGRVVCYAGPAVEPGSRQYVQFRLEKPVVARAGDPFVIRSWSPIATIGGGRVAEPAALRRKRLPDTVIVRLDAILDGGPEEAVTAAVVLAGRVGLPQAQTPVRTPLVPSAAERALQATALPMVGGHIYDPALVRDAEQRIVAALRAWHEAKPLAPGLSREQLRQAVPETDPLLADHAMAGLSTAGIVQTDGSLASLADHSPTLTPRQLEACDALLDAYRSADVASPLPADLPAHLAALPDLADLLHHLARSGRLVTLAPDRYITAEAADSAIARVRGHLSGRTGLGPGDFRDVFGISRKYLLPLLGWLDRGGITVREGELRDVPRLEAEHQEETA
jgi:selenocysteine-specific elongation factor